MNCQPLPLRYGQGLSSCIRREFTSTNFDAICINQENFEKTGVTVSHLHWTEYNSYRIQNQHGRIYYWECQEMLEK